MFYQILFLLHLNYEEISNLVYIKHLIVQKSYLQQQELESECEELKVEDPLYFELEIVLVKKEEVPQPEQQSFHSEQLKSQVILNNSLFQQHQEDTISLEDDNPQEVQQQIHPPQERQIILQSSRGEQMIMSFAPNQQQLFIKSQQKSQSENEVQFEHQIINQVQKEQSHQTLISLIQKMNMQLRCLSNQNQQTLIQI
ncbi:unnamed protein product [Paramecium primaurelia]|uniref:Uncharacterized protein n=1 Tax=Paramecium primaurelia TaxID=5886 RepID=A0A8S1LDF0_PARPR|nr:unnamed protein product [Paramecium primaurelia]